MDERARCKWVGSLGVVAVTQRVDGERQLVGLVIDVLPTAMCRGVIGTF